ncbi:MAG: hypothetical protein H6736_20445 [Alphaproteobacteria bacterium]|nr:hypothetical protein [Alphaproteobacteria bacterium]
MPRRRPHRWLLFGAVALVGLLVVGFVVRAMALHRDVEAMRAEVVQNVALMQAVDGGETLGPADLPPELGAVLTDASLDADGRRQALVSGLRARNRAVSVALGEAWDRSERQMLGAMGFAVATLALALVLVVLIDRAAEARAVALEAQVEREARARQAGLVEELAFTNTRMDRFAVALSHDLRAPLRAAIAHVELARRAGVEEPAMGHLGQVLASTRRMSEMLDGMLAVARAGRDPSIVPVDLDEALDEALARLQADLDEAGGTLERGSLGVVPGNRLDVISVLQNVLANAIRYRHPERPLRVVVSGARDSDTFHLVVDDNGVGVDPGMREKVFDLFVRGVSDSGPEGSGVGLAVCRSVLDRMGGRISLEPLAVGTRVSIDLRVVPGR